MFIYDYTLNLTVFITKFKNKSRSIDKVQLKWERNRTDQEHVGFSTESFEEMHNRSIISIEHYMCMHAFVR